MDGNAKCWVVFERSFSYLRLLPACSKIAQTNIKVERTRLLALVQLWTQEQAFNWLLIRWAIIRNYWGSIHWDDQSRRYYASEPYYTACKCCLSIFTKIKLLIINRDSPMVFSVIVLLLKHNFCLRNIFWCLSSKNLLGWDLSCLVHDMFCRNLAKLIIFAQFLHYYCQRWSPWTIFTANK